MVTLAAAAGIDPVEFRRSNLSAAKMRRVLDATAERFGWKPAPGPSGRERGIALGIDVGARVLRMPMTPERVRAATPKA